MPFLENYSARKQLLALLLIMVALFFIIQPFGILLAIPFVDGDIFTALQSMGQAKTPQDISLFKYFQIISQIGLFILSSYIFARMVSSRPFSFLSLNKYPKFSLIAIAVIIAIVSTPLLNWVMELNSRAHLPESFSSVENWMRRMEVEAARITDVLLSDSRWSALAVNLLMMAVLAGLGEELLLRGVVQPLFIRLTKNAHLGIWVAAALFSLMHLQFFGFLPRMLLGALFGYYYYWSRNLWIPIIAHIINNGFIVIYTFFYGTSSMLSIDEQTTDSNSFLLIMLSLSLTIAGLLFFYREGLKRHKPNGSS